MNIFVDTLLLSSYIPIMNSFNCSIPSYTAVLFEGKVPNREQIVYHDEKVFMYLNFTVLWPCLRIPCGH